MKTERRMASLVVVLMMAVFVLAPSAAAQYGPELAGRWPYGAAYDVDMSGEYAYYGSGSVLVVADVSDPAAPQTVSEIFLSDTVKGVTVSGRYVYVAADGAGLLVIDVSTPASPVEVGFYDTAGDTRGVAVSGSYAYLADYSEGLRVIDVSTPTLPNEVGFYDTSAYAHRVVVVGSYAYVADSWLGIRAVDVSTPSAPVNIGIYDTPGLANYGIAASGGLVFVSENDAGVEIFWDCAVVLFFDGFESRNTSTWSNTVP